MTPACIRAGRAACPTREAAWSLQSLFEFKRTARLRIKLQLGLGLEPAPAASRISQPHSFAAHQLKCQDTSCFAVRSATPRWSQRAHVTRHTGLETRLRIARLLRFLLFWNRLRPVRNVLVTHVHTFFQPGVLKSPLLYVHQILLP